MAETTATATATSAPSATAAEILNDLRTPSEGRFKFADMEEKVLQYWKKIDAFKTSLKLSEGRPQYTFYDGPPFATGRPHYGLYFVTS